MSAAPEPPSVLVVDAANVVGSRPDGWWRDRAAAAGRLHASLHAADPAYHEVVLVLEGEARAAVPVGVIGRVRTVHAPRDGDAAVLAEARRAADRGRRVDVVSADRALRARAEAVGAAVLGPSWLLDRLDGGNWTGSICRAQCWFPRSTGETKGGYRPPMVALRFAGPVLPEGEPRELYVVAGHVSHERHPGAETAAEGWIVPGLVDAHCHLGLDDGGPIDRPATEEQALQDRDAGALLIRDCGSAADTRWVQEREDLPRLIRAGRHIARTRRYIRHYAHEVEPEELPAYVAQEARRGDGWVKLVGDWISRTDGDLAPSFPEVDFAKAIAVAHEHGARVTAHCFGEAVLPGLIGAGIDCIEHGTGLSVDLIETMAARDVALVPTVMQIAKFPSYAEAGAERFPAYAAHMTALHARMPRTVMAAYEAGVALFAGSDGGGISRHGNLAGEVLAMHEIGLPAEYALGAASWRAREWLGWNAGLDHGAPADFVVYPRDPLADLTVLREPHRVVLRGRIVA